MSDHQSKAIAPPKEASVPTTGTNHVVLYVRDARRPQRFHERVPHLAIVAPLDIAAEQARFAAVGLR